MFPPPESPFENGFKEPIRVACSENLITVYIGINGKYIDIEDIWSQRIVSGRRTLRESGRQAVSSLIAYAGDGICAIGVRYRFCCCDTKGLRLNVLFRAPCGDISRRSGEVVNRPAIDGRLPRSIGVTRLRCPVLDAERSP